MIMSTFSLWSLVNPKITQHPLGLDLTAPAATDSKAAKIFLLLLYYIGTSVGQSLLASYSSEIFAFESELMHLCVTSAGKASVAFIIHIYNLSRQEDRALREDLLRRHGTQGTQLRPLPSDNGAYARRAPAAVAQSPHVSFSLPWSPGLRRVHLTPRSSQARPLPGRLSRSRPAPPSPQRSAWPFEPRTYSTTRHTDPRAGTKVQPQSPRRADFGDFEW